MTMVGVEPACHAILPGFSLSSRAMSIGGIRCCRSISNDTYYRRIISSGAYYRGRIIDSFIHNIRIVFDLARVGLGSAAASFGSGTAILDAVVGGLVGRYIFSGPTTDVSAQYSHGFILE